MLEQQDVCLSIPRLILGFMVVTAFLSMWISNTATTAMMVPIVEAMLQQMEATSSATEGNLGALELAEKGKASELPGEPWIQPSSGRPLCCQMCWLPPFPSLPPEFLLSTYTEDHA